MKNTHYTPQSKGRLNLIRHLESFEEQAEDSNTGLNRWLIPYADMITLVLAVFLLTLATLYSQNLALEEDHRALSKALDEKESYLAQKHSEVSQLSENLEAIQLNMLSLQQELKQEKSLLDSVVPEDASFEVSKELRGLVISIGEGILFEPGKADILTEGSASLHQIGELLKKTRAPIRIEGHTDDTPIQTSAFPSNWELSTARAVHVLTFLVEEAKLDPKRISASGYGEYRPIADNSTRKGKQKNRRVDIVVLNEASSNLEPASFQNQKSPSEVKNNETIDPSPAQATL